MLKRGDRNENVKTWQAWLNGAGYRDAAGALLVTDGSFGTRTDYATRAFQKAAKLTPDGIVGPKTIAAAGVVFPGPETGPEPSYPVRDVEDPELLPIAFVQARNYTPANRHVVDWIVMHTMEVPETASVAETVARRFAEQPKAGTILPNGKKAKGSSAHYNIDTDTIVQSVREKDVAWHAQGANGRGIGIEQAGYARQTPADWDDAPSRAILALAARLVADIAWRWDIPLVWLSPADILAGKRGVTGHVDFVQALKIGDHYDPGVYYPRDKLICDALRIREAYAALRRV